MSLPRTQARFFCEYCDYEVDFEAKICPHCGHFFASVRCPVCGKTGDLKQFMYGCPACGYAGTKKKQEEKKTRKKHTFYNPFSMPPGHSKKPTTGSLPIWVYIIVLFLVLGILLLAEAFL